MFSDQREVRSAMIEGHITPIAGVMTGTAVRAELPIVLILASVTGVTIRGRSLIHATDMTGCALDTRVFARQRESRVAMIEIHIRPAACHMTGTAVRTKLPIMLILASVTGITIRGRSLIHAIDMAGSTLHTRVFACQRESCFIMVKVHI